MRCADMAEFVSATVDGEAVPHDAAQHIAHCAACQELLKSYTEAGMALRRYAVAELAQPMPARHWAQPQRRFTRLWEKGWEKMRVPRIAFASLLLLLVGVASRLALVEVRAHEDGSVLLLSLSTVEGQALMCPLSGIDLNDQTCSGVIVVGKSFITYGVHLIRKEGDRALIAVISEYGTRSNSYTPDEINTLAKTQYWFSPGDHLKLASAGDRDLVATGQWTDHLPALAVANQELDPAANEIRISSPLLLKNSKVAGDLKGATAIADRSTPGVYIYLPGEGRFVFSRTPSAGAVPATVDLNRISFSSNNQSYVVVTGTPVARDTKLWVTHDPMYRPADANLQGGIIGTL